MRQPRIENGFSPIEIIVGVFTLLLVVTLVVPRIMGQTVKDKRTRADADMADIAQALHSYKAGNGAYPSTADGLQALAQPGRTRSGNPNGYLSSVPVDPWGHEYAYFTDGSRFLVKSYGADGREGGDGDNADITIQS